MICLQSESVSAELPDTIVKHCFEIWLYLARNNDFILFLDIINKNAYSVANGGHDVANVAIFDFAWP